ncbi:MAG: dTMP kinase [Candidatus Omnitrophota bacterium]
MKKGLFITFEGTEGCGKSTHSKLLAAFLKQSGFNVYHTREPGGTLIGEKIRHILLDASHNTMSALTELFLYMAARNQLVEKYIKQALKKGAIVICDRFLDASIAYQGYGLGLDTKMIRFLGNLATDGTMPDLTILLDINPEAGIRKTKRDDRIEKRSMVFHKKVYNGYHALARREPQRIKVVPVLKDIAHTQEMVRSVILRCLNKYAVRKAKNKS